MNQGGGGNYQYAAGSFIAQAAPGGTAIVVNYQVAPPVPVSPETLAAALDQLAHMPTGLSPAEDSGPGRALSAGSRLPFAANPLFIRREAELAGIAQNFRQSAGPGVPTATVIAGIGGMGKTQLAIQFAHQYGPYFAGGVYWVSFADLAAIPGEVAACGGTGAMDLRPDFAALGLEDQVRLVLSAWRSDLPRLLIFDNCGDDAELARWLPRGGGSRVLITSRRDQWDPTLGVTVIRLDTLDRIGSVTLLRKYRPDLAADDPGLDQVAAELDGLPLALHLAGSFLLRYRAAVTPQRYAADLARPELIGHRSLERSGVSPTGHVQSVARTFALSYERLDPSTPRDALALAVLARACRLAPGEQIPRPLLIAAAGHREAARTDEPDDLDAVLATEDALGRTMDLGLLEATARGSLRMHRMVAAFLLNATKDDDTAQLAVETAVRSDYESRRQGSGLLSAGELLAHLRTVTDASLGRRDEGTVALASLAGDHLREMFSYPDACRYLAAALEIAEQIRPPDDPSLALPLNNLGFALLRAERIDEALGYLQRAIPLWQRSGDEENLAATLDNIGQLIRARDPNAAEGYFLAALEIRERVHGIDHPRTGVTLNNLGSLATSREQFEAAEGFLRAALVAKERAPTRTPSLAVTHVELAQLLMRKQDFAAGHQHYAAAAEIYSATLGPEHPVTVRALARADITSPALFSTSGPALMSFLAPVIEAVKSLPDGTSLLSNVGFTFWLLGEDDGAGLLYHAALRTGGTRGNMDVVVLNNLGMLMQRRHDYTEARRFFEQALALLEDADQQDVLLARVRNNLGLLLLQTGELERSRQLLDQALAARERLLGENTPDTAITCANLALLAAHHGDLDAARVGLQAALSVLDSSGPAASPQAARVHRDLGAVLRSAQEPVAALGHLQRALATQRTHLTARHPELIDTLAAIGALAQEQGQPDAARWLAEAHEISAFRFGADHPRTAALTEALTAEMPAAANGAS